jgi:hypothetical protein
MPFQKGRAKVGGRKKGTPNKASAQRKAAIAAIEETAARLGLQPIEASPLQVMCTVMCLRLQERDYESAVDIAAMAAPYIHARLNATDVSIRHSVANRSDAEIALEIEALRAKVEQVRALPAPPVIDTVVDGDQPNLAETG